MKIRRNKKKKPQKKASLSSRTRASKKIDSSGPNNTEDKREKPKEKKRFLRTLFKYTALASLMFFVVVASVAAVISYKVDGDTMQSILVNLVAENTNGELKIEKTEFHPWTGLILKGVSLYPRKQPSHNSPAILQADQIAIRYSFWKIFLFNLSIAEAHIESPTIRIHKIGGKLNALALVKEKKPSKEKPSPLLKFAKFLIPVWGKISKTGFSNLNLIYSTEQLKSVRKNFIQIANLSLDIDLNWFFIKSNGLLRLHSPEKFPTVLKIQIPGKEAINLKAKLDNRITIKDYLGLGVSLNNRLDRLLFEGRSLENIPTSFETSLQISKDLESVDIKKLDLIIEKMFVTKTAGKVSLVNGKTDATLIDTKTSLKINLDYCERIAKTFLPNAEMSGLVEIDRTVVNGVLSPKKNSDYSLPNAAVLATLKNVSAKIPSLGIEIQKINSTTELDITQSLLTQGINLNLKNQLKLNSIGASLKDEKVQLESKIEKVNSYINLSTSYPDITIPNLQLQIDAQKVMANSKKYGKIATNLSLNTTFASTAEFKTVSSSGNAEMKGILDSYWLLQCEDKCEKQRVNLQTSILSLGKVFEIAKPVLIKTMEKKQVPEKLSGKVQIKLASKGYIPFQSEKDQKKLVELSDMTIDSETSIQNMSLKMPLYKLDLKNMDLDLSCKGDYISQIIKMDHRIPKVSLKPDGFKKPIVVRGYDNQIEIVNNFDSKPSPNQLPQKFTTQVSVEMDVDDTLIEDIIPVNVTSTQVRLKTSQKDLKEIEVSTFNARLPSLGIETNNKTKLTLDQEKNPQAIETSGSLTAEKDIGDSKIAKLSTSGSLKLDYDVKTPDLDYFEILSNIEFDHFRVKIPKEDGKGDLINVDDLHGKIPFKQKVSIKDAKERVAKSGFVALKETKKKRVDDNEVIENFYQDVLDEESRKINLVEKVDYGNLKHYYDQRKRITARRLYFDKIKFDDVVVDFEIDQNEVKVKNYSLSFLGGAIQGQLGLLIDVLPISLASSVHFTNLNATRLFDELPDLKRKAKNLNVDETKKIAGTIQFDYDFKSHSMDGNVDITSIGKDQLKLLLYYIDPEEKKPNITSIRKALIVGDLNLVRVPINQGDIGLELDLRLLGAPIPLPQIKKFPVSQIVRNFERSAKEDLLEENTN